jgi:chromosome segregation ATPase
MFAIVFACAAAGGSLVARAQQAAAAPDVLSALLIEVRGLRAAMEQLASADARVQLALGRVQLQEQRIANQIRRLDTVRASLFPAQKELEPLEVELTEFEASMRRYTGPPTEDRRLAEDNLKELRTRVARRRAEVQRLTAEEALLTQDIAAEQGRWTDFNQRLEELERALSRR